MKKLFIGFFLSMFLFTILSRIVDTYRIPKISAVYPGKGSVVSTVKGTGVVEAEDTKRVPILEGLRIDRVEAGPGAEVTAGEPLFYYEAESLLDKRESLQKEIQKLELNLESERLGGIRYEGVTNVELAEQELLAAKRAYERQQEKTRKAQEEYTENLLELKEYYDKRLLLSEEQILEQSRIDYQKSRDTYETQRMEQDAQINGLERKIKDTEKKIERLENKEEPDEDDEEKLEELELLLEQYEEELRTAEEKWDLTLEQAKDDRNIKEDILDRAEQGVGLTRLDIEKDYNSSVKQEEEKLEAAQEQELDQGVILEQAATALESARKNDGAKALNDGQTRRLADLLCQSIQLDLDEKKEELAAVIKLTEQGGAVYAPADGVTTLSELEAGKETGKTERFMLAVGALRLKGTFSREEDGQVDADHEVQIWLEGEEKPVTAMVSRVDMVTDGKEGTFYAGLPDGTGALGNTASFEYTKRSGSYQTVIPVLAVRKDMKGEYCLVLRSHKTILGEEYRAARVNLKLLVRGDTQAAVEGALTPQERIITTGDRIVNEGDRVRPIVELNRG